MRLLRRPQAQTEEIRSTGNCTVRERTADGAPVGQCYYATFNGVCPRHGQVGQWLDGRVDENDIPPRPHRDYGSEELRRFLVLRYYPSGSTPPELEQAAHWRDNRFRRSLGLKR